ncbi:EAL domain-containing protein [Francisella philomiragia]|uniref:EAL domain-containing protein n=1 Tax=Francisella philomiragia TaxID=28110 RepID=UPI0035138490
MRKDYSWTEWLSWPVVIVDFFGQIKSFNKLFEQEIGFIDAENYSSTTINAVIDIREYWELYVQNPTQKNVFHYHFNDRTYLLSFSSIESDKEIIISLIDVHNLGHEHASEEYKIFEKQSASLFYILDLNGKLTYANDTFKKTITSKPTSEVYFTRNTEVWQNTSAIIKTRAPKVFRETMLTVYGNRSFLSQKFLILNKKNQTLGVASVSIDMGSFDKVNKDKDIAEFLLRNTDDSVMVTDSDLNIVYLNDTFEKMTGYSKSEAIGNKPSLISSGKHNQQFYKKMWDMINTTGVWEGEIWNRRKSGELYLTWAKISSIKRNNKPYYYVSVETDISKRRIRLDEIEKYAYHDMLTGLHNRYYFESYINETIESGSRKKHPFVLMFLDLDHFKEVNDVYGHLAGDKLLIEVASRLKDLTRSNDLVARLGGDEFLLFFADMETNEAVIKAQKIINNIAKPYQIDDKSFVVGASIGLVSYPDDAIDFENLLRYADAAMYKAKNNGRNRFFLYNQEISDKIIFELQVKQAILDAFENNDLIQILFQPQVNVRTKAVYGVEILSRINHPELGTLLPSSFIPVLQSMNKMPEFDMIVLNKACEQMVGSKILYQENIRISQNVTVPVIMSREYCEKFVNIIKVHNIKTYRFSFEVIENIAINDYNVAYDNFAFLSASGISVEIDDFGSGYSSLNYLAKFPISTLKIDSFFVQNIGNARERKICQAIISLAKNLDLEVIGEGIQTSQQADELIKLGCYIHQGYLYSKPITIDELNTKIKEKYKFTDVI